MPPGGLAARRATLEPHAPTTPPDGKRSAVTALPTSPSKLRDLQPRKAFASGPAPYRALLVGGGPVVDDDALVEALAQGLAQRTGHGVDVETVPSRPIAEAAAGTLLAERDLSRVDAVVVVLDPDRRAGRVTAAVGDLVDGLAERMTVGSPLVVVVPPPFALGLTPRQIDDLVAQVREHTDALTPIVRLDDEGPLGSRDDRSARWADAIAEATGAGLIEPMVRFLPDDHHDEDLRLSAVDRLPPRDGLWVAQFQRFVDEAQAAYGTKSAALSIIDADHARYGVTVGFDNAVIRRGQTICNRVLRTYGGLIVGDAAEDLRFQRNPDVKSGDVRFYAGHRIESEDGAPLGSLCVFDPAPRDEVDEADLVALRDLAIELQRRIWTFQRQAS